MSACSAARSVSIDAAMSGSLVADVYRTPHATKGFSALPDKHRFADDFAVDHRLDRIGRALQREAMRDARTKFALARQLDEQLGVGAADFGLVLGRAAEPHADHLKAFDEKIIGARGRWAATEEAEHQDTAAKRQTAQRL